MVGHADSFARTVYVDVTLTRYQGQGHGAFELPTISRHCTFPGLSLPPLSHGAQN